MERLRRLKGGLNHDPERVYDYLCLTAKTLSSTLRLRPDGRTQSLIYFLLFAETPKNKIHSSAVCGFPQIDVLFCNCLAWAFAAAASAAEWFFIAALPAPLNAKPI